MTTSPENSAAATCAAPIVLVDDDPGVLAGVAAWLGRAGYIVEPFTNALDALEFIAEHRVSMAIVDVHMPEIDGLEMLMLLGQTRPDIKVLAISGESRVCASIMLEMAGHLGACRTLAKPFSGGELFAVVGEIVGSSAAA